MELINTYLGMTWKNQFYNGVLYLLDADSKTMQLQENRLLIASMTLDSIPTVALQLICVAVMSRHDRRINTFIAAHFETIHHVKVANVF